MTSKLSIEQTIARVVTAIAPVRGVCAIALGGSRARGWHHAHSDIDIGLYYEGGSGMDIAAINATATALDDTHRENLATGLGGWGAWVDGGAWLTVDGVPVDLIYRDLKRVDRVIAEVSGGEFQIAYHIGHPHGFVSSFYAGEIAIAIPLHDPEGVIAARKASLKPYPEAFRREAMRRFLGEASFWLLVVRKPADAAYSAGVTFRIVACLCHVLFVLNREWLINEKGAVACAATLPLHPADFAARVAGAFADCDSAARAVVLTALVEETAELVLL